MLYVLIINMIGFLIMLVDKGKAKKKKRRIAEKTIWFVSLLGGAVGTTIGMYVFRHKTKHRAFRYGLPILLLLEVLIYFIYT